MDELDFIRETDGFRSSIALVYDELPIKLICELADVSHGNIILTEQDMDTITCASEYVCGMHPTDYLGQCDAKIYVITSDCGDNDPIDNFDIPNPYRDIPNVEIYIPTTKIAFAELEDYTVFCGNACIGRAWYCEWSEYMRLLRCNDPKMHTMRNRSFNYLNPDVKSLYIIETDSTSTDTNPIIKSIILDDFALDPWHMNGITPHANTITGGRIWSGKK